MNFSEDLIQDHTRVANKALAFICRLVMIFMLIVVGCAMAGCFAIPDAIYPAAAVALGILFIPTVLYDFLKMNSGLIRYFVLTLMVLLVGMLYVLMGYNVVMLLAFPIVLACIYCDYKCLIYTFLIGIPVIVVSHIMGFQIQMVPDDPLKSMDAVVKYGIVPRMIEYFAISVVCYGITGRISHLLKKLKEVNNELYQDQENLVAALAGLIETQSKETGQHVKRVSEYTKILCKALGMPDEEVWKVGLGAMMHDVGKVAVPASILDKPDRLTPEEYLKIKWHVFYGKEMLEKYPGEIMQLSANIAFQHHEHYDGTGYLGMQGEEINLYARCVSLGDFFDALVSKRVYKAAWKPEEARTEILNQRGKYFDPHIVDLFEIHYHEFLQVMREYPDEDMPSSIEEIFDINKIHRIE